MLHKIIKSAIIIAIIATLYIMGYFAVGSFEITDKNRYIPPKPKAVSAVDAERGNLIDLNRASADEVKSLPGIGEKKAKAIVEMRDEMRGYKTVEDVLCADGIGETILNNIRPFITVGEYLKN